jgi:hypothetical protein
MSWCNEGGVRGIDLVVQGPPQARSSRRRSLLVVGIVTVVLFALFWFMHTGGRAGTVCGDAGLASTSEDAIPSLWPPGARCIGGSEQPDSVRLDATFLIVTPAVVLMVCAASLPAALRRRRS